MKTELTKQEPDKYVMDIECTKCGAKQSGVLTVNTTPPQRTWVGLAEEEVIDLWPDLIMHRHTYQFWQNLEAKLKEKNT